MTGIGTRLQPGQRIGAFEVLSIDPNGKRACVSCRCGQVDIFSTDALLDGSATCSALRSAQQKKSGARGTPSCGCQPDGAISKMTLGIGDRVDAWTVISIGPNGRQAICECVCSTTKILAVRSLLDGTSMPSCGCTPLTRKQQRALRDEVAERQRRRVLKDWRPSGGR